MSQEEISLVGTIDRVVYEQAETGFMIANFIPEGKSDPITIKGTIFNVGEQSLIEVKGRWETHKTYGKQLAVAEFAPVLPKTTVGIERFLSSDIPGIGEKTAERIVKAFGEDTFKIIDESPEELLTVNKFTRKQLDMLLEVWEEKREERDTLTFLHECGCSTAQALKIVQHYGLSAIPVMKSNPYQITEIHGIGFLIADQLARNLGFDENSPERAIAAVLYMLTQFSHNGHTCYPRPLLKEQTSKELKIKLEIVDTAISQLVADQLIKSKVLPPAVQDGDPIEMIAHKRLFNAERTIAEELTRVFQSDAFTHFDDPEHIIERIQRKIGIHLDPVQWDAVTAALKHKVLIITGGPGTGKTTIIRFILELVRNEIPDLALAAPTGRAAKRMAEANQRPASTIHRLLGASRNGFEKNRDNPIDSELIIIDEISMMDTPLMAAMLEAIRSEARLILVGDVDQLPSVGPGAVLLNLIASEVIPVVRLETIFRQAADSLITVNAHSVRKGTVPKAPKSNPKELLDYYFIKESDPQKVVDKIILMATERIPKRFNFDPKSDIQILTPMHRGITGSVNLNQQLQKSMNQEKDFLKYKEIIFKAGDKVLQQQNSYEKEVFNGDVGIITQCDVTSKMLTVQYDHKEVRYEADEMDQLTLAYAISVHKSQGSEYPAVIMPLTTHHYVMLQRNLLYTAMTRGKQLVVIVGMENALQLAVENSSPALRYTLLQSEFKDMWEEAKLF